MEPSHLAGLTVKLKSSEVAREKHKSSCLITFFMAFQVQKSKQKWKWFREKQRLSLNQRKLNLRLRERKKTQLCKATSKFQTWQVHTGKWAPQGLASTVSRWIRRHWVSEWTPRPAWPSHCLIWPVNKGQENAMLSPHNDLLYKLSTVLFIRRQSGPRPSGESHIASLCWSRMQLVFYNFVLFNKSILGKWPTNMVFCLP